MSRRRRDQKRLLGMGVGAGILGAILFGLGYAGRRRQKPPVPDTISPSIFATRVLQTGPGQVVYHESGTGQPILFIHGVYTGASSYEWSKVYPEFAQRFRVLAPDLIGFGESGRPAAQLHAIDYVQMLAEFIQATCGGERPILIGSGMGAGFCVYIASQHPEMVSRSILLMPAGMNDSGISSARPGVRLASRLPLVNRLVYRNYQSTPKAVRDWLNRFGFADPARVTDEAVEVVTTCAQQYGAEHAILNFQAGRLDFDLLKRLKTLVQPVTLVWGDKAIFPPLEWAYRMQPLLRNCSLRILEGASTLAALEMPRQVIDLLTEELQSEFGVFKAL